MKMKKCSCCKNYTLKDSCENEKCGCKKETTSAHYKHVRIKGGKDKGKE